MTSVRLWHDTRGTGIYLFYNARGARYSFMFKPKSALCIIHIHVCLVSHTYNGTEHRAAVWIILAPVHVYFASTRACINEGHFRIENDQFFMNRIFQFDSIWWKHTNLRPVEKPRITYCQCFLCFSDRNNAAYHSTAG